MFEPKTPYFDAPRRRATFLIIHGIGTSLERAEEIFTGKSEYEVSVPYLVTQKGEIRQYLDETVRAYHAGVSYWSGITDINSTSIGIELETEPTKDDLSVFEIARYSQKQMEVLADLCKGIIERNKIQPYHVLGHQDIAPGRKPDPGQHFNWKLLSELGVGVWHGLESVKEDPVVTNGDQIGLFKNKLGLYGYDIRESTNFPEVIRAFQTHFLPWNITGQVTEQSIHALNKLLEMKYGQF